MKQLIYGAALTFSSIWFSRRILPKITNIFLDRPASKLFLMSILSLCAVFSAISTLTGLSIEFGAMTAGQKSIHYVVFAYSALGMTLSDSDIGRNAISKLRPLTHMFSGSSVSMYCCISFSKYQLGILFGSIGMLLSPRFMLFHLWTIIGTLLVVIFVKFISGFFVAQFSGQSRFSSLTIGLSISTVAEFGMILAAKVSLLLQIICVFKPYLGLSSGDYKPDALSSCASCDVLVIYGVSCPVS
jgi:monovalent cation:H+ antiporter-2, CPA2 family